jgi:hypothetical protein
MTEKLWELIKQNENKEYLSKTFTDIGEKLANKSYTILKDEMLWPFKTLQCDREIYNIGQDAERVK